MKLKNQGQKAKASSVHTQLMYAATQALSALVRSIAKTHWLSYQ